MRALMDANNARAPYRLKPGDRVQLPRPKSYTVQRGDTLYAISRRQGLMSRLWRALTGCRRHIQFRWARNCKCPAVMPAPGTATPNVKSRTDDCQGTDTAPCRAVFDSVDGRVFPISGRKPAACTMTALTLRPLKARRLKRLRTVWLFMPAMNCAAMAIFARAPFGWLCRLMHTSKFRVAAAKRSNRAGYCRSWQFGKCRSPAIAFRVAQGNPRD